MTTSSVDDRSAATGDPRRERFRVLLQRQRAERLRERELALADTVQSVPDEVAVTVVTSLQRTIAEIDAALARIAAGTYGRCLHCGADLPEGLELRPFATGCVSCQRAR